MVTNALIRGAAMALFSSVLTSAMDFHDLLKYAKSTGLDRIAPESGPALVHDIQDKRYTLAEAVRVHPQLRLLSRLLEEPQEYAGYNEILSNTDERFTASFIFWIL